MKAVFTPLALLGVSCSGGSAAPETGVPLVDEVVRLEGGMTPCVTFHQRGQVFKSDSEGPPAMLVPESFEEAEAQRAARAIAIDWRMAPRLQPETVGIVAGDRCLMSVSGAAFSGEFAFLTYSDPDGELGAYAFKKSGEGWKVVEKAPLGFW